MQFDSIKVHAAQVLGRLPFLAAESPFVVTVPCCSAVQGIPPTFHPSTAGKQGSLREQRRLEICAELTRDWKYVLNLTTSSVLGRYEFREEGLIGEAGVLIPRGYKSD